MKRREIIGGLAATIVLPTVAARAQQPARTVRIGFLITAPLGSPEFRATVDPFTQALGELGYVEGRNLVIEYKSADGKQERFPSLAADLVRIDVDLILAGSTPHARAAQQATRTIPIVVASMGDPVADGLVTSLSRPGGNITGLTSLGPELTSKRLELLKQALPNLNRVTILWEPGAFSEATTNDMLKAITSAARTLRLQTQFIRVDGADRLDSAFSAMTREQVEALLILHSSMFLTERRRIVALVAKQQLPSMFPSKEYVVLGGLVAYRVSVDDLFRRSAGYVDKILKGAKPADLPVEQPTKFELVINLKAASALGLTVPATLLAQVNQVFE